MPFAQLLDDFSTDLHAWTTPSGGDAFAFTIAGGQLAGGGNQTAGVMTRAGQFGLNSEAGILVPTLPAAGSVVQVMICMDGTGPSWNGYQVRMTPSTSTWLVRRVDAGTPTQLASLTQAFVAGDFFGVRKIGSLLETWYGSGGVANAVLIDARTDNTYSVGYLGLVTNDAATRFDNFFGGNVGYVPRQPPLNVPQQPFQVFFRAVIPPTTTIDVTLGLVTEVDVALTLGRSKARTLGLVLETDAVLALSRSKQRTMGLVTETDLALAPSRAKSKTLVLVTGADLALTLSRAKSKTIGLVTETDTPLTVSRVKSRVLGLVTESDLTLAISSGVTAVVNRLRMLRGMGQ